MAISPTQQEILRKLAAVCELSPDVRFGQLASHLGFLAEDMYDQGLAEIADDQLLQVLERYEAELSRRQTNVA
jgi:hypothetical protein